MRKSLLTLVALGCSAAPATPPDAPERCDPEPMTVCEEYQTRKAGYDPTGCTVEERIKGIVPPPDIAKCERFQQALEREFPGGPRYRPGVVYMR